MFTPTMFSHRRQGLGGKRTYKHSFIVCMYHTLVRYITPCSLVQRAERSRGEEQQGEGLYIISYVLHIYIYVEHLLRPLCYILYSTLL